MVCRLPFGSRFFHRTLPSARRIATCSAAESARAGLLDSKKHRRDPAIVDDCFATGAASACDLIQRIPTTDGGVGPISRILNQNINADSARTRGVDLEMIWTFESFLVRGLFGRLDENSTTTAAGTTQDQAQSQTRPKYSGILTGTYTLGPWALMLQGTYYDKVMNNNTWVEGVDIDDNWIDAQSTFNFGASYRGKTTHGMGWTASFNVTNLFDAPPSIVANATGQTTVLGHDLLGRRYQLSLNLEF